MLAAHGLVAVHAWPQRLQLAVDELRSHRALTVISVPTPITSSRTLARDLIRTALRETLAVFLDQPPVSIMLVSCPGQAIWVDSPFARLQVSVSHLPGLSVAAIGRGACVGIDVMDVAQGTQKALDWERVALDYLGPTVACAMQRMAPQQRPAAFAQAWTRFEACLKCLGCALTEWTPVLQLQLATCRVMPLALPDNLRGTIAINAAAGAVALLTDAQRSCQTPQKLP